MEKKVELQVLNISNSQAQIGAYALLLGEVDGKRQISAIMGPAEAQATALYLKGVKTPRPLTHDLLHSCLSALDTELIRVVIYKANEGIFYSHIYLYREKKEVIRIDSRTSDAMALAVRAGCPIFIYESILERECIPSGDEDKMDDDIEEEEESNADNESITHTLEEKLNKAIEEENYELAARFRDEIYRQK